MAFAMAFTMMAGAAYTDQADITATEAVDTLAALNIMTGDTDGSFRPNDTVTRAEMCRMIYSIRNQGKSDASAYAKMQTTFTDVGESAWFWLREVLPVCRHRFRPQQDHLRPERKGYRR